MEQQQFQLHFDIEEQHWWFQGRRSILREVIGKLVSPSRDTVLLEIGCGTGGNLRHFLPYYHVAGCDISEHAIHFAQQKLTGIDLIVGYAPDDVQEWMHRAKIILLLDVLEHVKDDVTLLRRILDSMSTGAILVLTVPADRRLWSPHDRAFGHLRRYEFHEFASLVALPSSTCLLLSFFSSRFYPIIRGIRYMNALRGKSSGKAGTDFWLPTPFINRLLQAIFSGEASALHSCLYTSKSAYSFGSSLICILEKKVSVSDEQYNA